MKGNEIKVKVKQRERGCKNTRFCSTQSSPRNESYAWHTVNQLLQNSTLSNPANTYIKLCTASRDTSFVLCSSLQAYVPDIPDLLSFFPSCLGNKKKIEKFSTGVHVSTVRHAIGYDLTKEKK